MAIDAERLRALVDEVARFYVRDARLTKAQRSMSELLARGEMPASGAVSAYVRTVRAYFSGFEREARAHLSDVEGRLERVAQTHFNLSAERGVAQRRVVATQAVLAQVAEIEPA